MSSDGIGAVRGVLSAAHDGVNIPCYVQPRSSREAVVGVHDGALKVALTAPPVDGKANEALCRFVAKALRLPKTAVRLSSGQSSRRKVLTVHGLEAEEIAVRLCVPDDKR